MLVSRGFKLLLHLAKRGNTRQQMASKVIREVGNGNSTVQLKNTQGKPLEVSITSHKIRKNSARPQVSFNQLRKLRSQGKFSDTTVDKVVTPFIREGLIKSMNVRSFLYISLLQRNKNQKIIFNLNKCFL